MRGFERQCCNSEGSSIPICGMGGDRGCWSLKVLPALPGAPTTLLFLFLGYFFILPGARVVNEEETAIQGCPSSLHETGLAHQRGKYLNLPPPLGSLDWSELITTSCMHHSHALSEHLLYTRVWVTGELEHHQEFSQVRQLHACGQGCDGRCGSRVGGTPTPKALLDLCFDASSSASRECADSRARTPGLSPTFPVTCYV